MKSRVVFRYTLAVSGLFALFCGVASCKSASSSSMAPKAFSTPDAAIESLVSALRAHDTAKLHNILGPSGDDILNSGDEVADRADVERFLSLYDQEHSVRTEEGGVHTLLVGEKSWPFPVPIVHSQDGYEFDSNTGREEILNRRIGRNELDAEQVCLAIADAQREYVHMRPMGGDLPEYAQRILSDPGKKNGLFWPTAEGQPPSPLGPLVASATAGGYGATGAAPATTQAPAPASSSRPYRGYRYRLLTSQGAHAKGGAVNYLVDGRLIGGFGVVAYPAEYGNSGIMTFITNHDGVVYQRDLGPGSEKIAQAMTEFDPGPEWKRDADGDEPPLDVD